MVERQIESLRHKKEWSQAELAQRLHISPSTVDMYEQGRREPFIDALVAVSKEFGVTIDHLFTGKVCTLIALRHSERAEHVRDIIVVLKDFCVRTSYTSRRETAESIVEEFCCIIAAPHRKRCLS